jgi:hypothetical protein
MRVSHWKLALTCASLSLGCGGNAVDLGHADDWADLPAEGANSAEPQTLFESSEQVLSFTADDTTLYALITRGNPIRTGGAYGVAQAFELVSCPIEACKSQRQTLYSGPLPELATPRALTLVAGSLFWSLQELGVASCSVGGCSAPTLIPAVTDTFAGDDEHLYWVEAKSALMRVAPGAGKAEVVRSFPSLDAGYVAQVSARGAFFHFVNQSGSVIYRIRKDGSSDPEPFVMDENISSVAVNAQQLYYSSSNLAGRIAQGDLKDATAGIGTLAEQQRWPGDLRIDGGEMFWMNRWPQPQYPETATLTLTSCPLPDCAAVRSWPIDFALAVNGAPVAREYLVNRRYIIWATTFIAAGGSATQLVLR